MGGALVSTGGIGATVVAAAGSGVMAEDKLALAHEPELPGRRSPLAWGSGDGPTLDRDGDAEGLMVETLYRARRGVTLGVTLPPGQLLIHRTAVVPATPTLPKRGIHVLEAEVPATLKMTVFQQGAWALRASGAPQHLGGLLTDQCVSSGQ